MSHKKLRRHVETHYSEMIDLREEIANALKLAKDPAKLVLYSIGRFFVLRTIKFRPCVSSHKKDDNIRRLAAVLILECFVMISGDGIEIEKRDREYVAEVAVVWRKRMIKEGGLGHTDEVDARGLLLLISGFGIQDDVFTIQDIMDLVRASNVKGISIALRRSIFLIPKIPEVIYLMVKNNLEIEAVDIANTFGLEDVCNRRNILTTNLHNKIIDIQNAPPLQMNNENVITPESLEEVDILKKPEETAALMKPEEIDILKKPEEIAALKKPDEVNILETLISVLTKPEEADTLISEENDTWKKTTETGVVSVLQSMCRRMNSNKLMRHIRKHISEMNNLRVDIASALKLAEDPAELVKNCIGRFFERSGKEF
ncbi:protein FRIGIDA-like [Bidens hawaiensis]|uniref:protein FRIGIDA-like n=1 Tax=Bidens hawaiensis TaxID=980011 RepID=UPI00404AD861